MNADIRPSVQTETDNTALRPIQVCEFIVPRRKRRDAIDVEESTAVSSQKSANSSIGGDICIECAVWTPANIALETIQQLTESSPSRFPTVDLAHVSHNTTRQSFYTSLQNIYLPYQADNTSKGRVQHFPDSLSGLAHEPTRELYVKKNIHPVPNHLIGFVKALQIELWIDQEGHRSIRPQFSFKRELSRHSSTFNDIKARRRTESEDHDGLSANPLQELMRTSLVDLRPSTKAVGTFHCGTVSREAMIRRLVINGQSDKDYLSTNIILPLAENGIYGVYGRENGRKKKSVRETFVWKFEYTIEDKRAAKDGSIIAGEKLLRPISFICSPEMFLPSQASNVTLVHLLSKKLKPSPTAKRILPPPMPYFHDASHVNLLEGSEPLRDSGSSCSGSVRYAVKSLSRPTTPMTDRRLRIGLDPEGIMDGTSLPWPASTKMDQQASDFQFHVMTPSAQHTFDSTATKAYPENTTNVVTNTAKMGLEVCRGYSAQHQPQFYRECRIEEDLSSAPFMEELIDQDTNNRTTQVSPFPARVCAKEVHLSKGRPATEPISLYQRSSLIAYDTMDSSSYKVSHPISATEPQPRRMSSDKELSDLLERIHSFIREEQDRLSMIERGGGRRGRVLFNSPSSHKDPRASIDRVGRPS